MRCVSLQFGALFTRQFPHADELALQEGEDMFTCLKNPTCAPWKWKKIKTSPKKEREK